MFLYDEAVLSGGMTPAALSTYQLHPRLEFLARGNKWKTV